MKFLKNIRLTPGMYQMCMYGIGSLLIRSISLVMIPYVTHKLIPAEYGIFLILVLFSDVCDTVVQSSIIDPLFRFSGMEDNPAKKNHICSVAMGIIILLTLLFCTLAYTLSSNVRILFPGHITQLQFTIVLANIGLESLSSVQLAWLRLMNKATHYFLITTARAITQAVIVFTALAFGYGVTGMLASITIPLVAAVIGLFSVQYGKCGVRFSWVDSKPLLRYGGPLVFTAIAAFIMSGLDQWWLGKVVGVGEMALYALAMKFVMIAAILMEPFFEWWQPRRFALLGNDENVKANANIASMGVTFAILAALSVGLGGSYAIKWLTPDSYHGATQFVPWLAMVWAIRCITNILDLGCYVGLSTIKPTAINIGCSLLSLLGYYIFTKPLGVYGIILTIYIVFLIRFGLMIYLAQKNHYLPYPGKRLLAMILVVVFAMIMGSKFQEGIWQIPIKMLIILLVTSIGLWLRLVPRLQNIFVSRS